MPTHVRRLARVVASGSIVNNMLLAWTRVDDAEDRTCGAGKLALDVHIKRVRVVRQKLPRDDGRKRQV